MGLTSFFRDILDTAKHSVSGTVEITYSNNSPDNLKFLWLQLDQNIYRKDSRGSATTTESGGRWANAKFTEGYVIKSISGESNGKTFTPKYNVTDTRLQAWLPEAAKDKVEEVKEKVSKTKTKAAKTKKTAEKKAEEAEEKTSEEDKKASKTE